MKTVMLCGAGGTGKTAVLDDMSQRMGSRPFQRMQSITRQAYKALGIDSEKVALDTFSESEMKAFQTTVLETYQEVALQKLDECIAGNNELFMLERSPYDYVAYQIYVLPSLPLNEINDMLSRADEFMEKMSLKTELFCWYLPYPTPWTRRATDDGSSYDDVRYAPAGKNYAWDSILRRLIRLQDGGGYLSLPPKFKFEYMVPVSIAERGRVLVNSVYPMPNEPTGDPVVAEGAQ